jgi:hypothetical protein
VLVPSNKYLVAMESEFSRQSRSLTAAIVEEPRSPSGIAIPTLSLCSNLARAQAPVLDCDVSPDAPHGFRLEA